MISAGIDCGAKSTKTIIINNGQITGRGSVITGFDQKQAVKESLEIAINNSGLQRNDVQKIGGTGSGKNAVYNADIQINDLKAMGKGAHFFFPETRTITDVGAEEVKAARLDNNGNILDFAINEKCAAGAGAFIEAMARALETSLEEIGQLALESDKEIPINAQCVIFAESEIIGLIHSKIEKHDISRAIHDAIASRVVSMIRRIGINEDVTMLGGVGYNPGFVEALRRDLNLAHIYIPDNPEFGSAVGAAVVASEEE